MSRAEYQKRWRQANPDKHKQYQATYWAKPNNAVSGPERARKSKLKITYGLTLEDFDILLRNQNYLCAICGTDKPTGKWKRFAVDHCHKTGEVRGLLCNECNRGMGLLKDNALLLRKAADYLDEKMKKEKPLSKSTLISKQVKE